MGGDGRQKGKPPQLTERERTQAQGVDGGRQVRNSGTNFTLLCFTHSSIEDNPIHAYRCAVRMKLVIK